MITMNVTMIAWISLMRKYTGHISPNQKEYFIYIYININIHKLHFYCFLWIKCDSVINNISIILCSFVLIKCTVF